MKIGEMLKGFGVTLVVAVLGAVIIRLLLPIPTNFTISLILFVFVLEIILKELEKDTATKRALNKIMILLGGMLAFIGLRIVIGYIFNMPLIDSHNALDVKDGSGGIIGSTYKAVPPQIVLELLFIIPGYFFARGLVKGGKTTRTLIYLFSFAMFFVFLWQVKQVNHANAAKRLTQANIDQQANKFDAAAIQKEGFARLKMAELIEDYNGLKKGEKVAIISDQVEMDMAEPMLKVVREENGTFNGEMVLVPNRKLKLLYIEIETTDKLPADKGIPQSTLVTLKKGDLYSYNLAHMEASPWILAPTGVNYNIDNAQKTGYKVYYWGGQVVDVTKTQGAPNICPAKFKIVNTGENDIFGVAGV